MFKALIILKLIIKYLKNPNLIIKVIFYSLPGIIRK